MILGVESSCDESALALLDPASGLCGEWVHSQLDLHREYGGVVPELASREHLETFPVLLEKVMGKVKGLSAQIEEIAVTCGPGLAPCLALGVSVSRALGIELAVPVRAINHLRGHAFSVFIKLHEANPLEFFDSLQTYLPHLGLLVSGGNTLLFEIRSDLSIQVLAQTVDDAAGEALDKGAKLLGLDYPGGALLEKNALGGDPTWRDFPRAFAKKPELRFSFSGLKTSLRYLLEKMEDADVDRHFADLCASYQAAVVDQLASKTKQVLSNGQFKSLGLSGGVANNQALRQRISTLAQSDGCPLFLAEPSHTGDNAAMIAFAALVEAHNHKIMYDSQPSIPLLPSLKINQCP